jgi:quinoprotein glucose dehydrogenase
MPVAARARNARRLAACVSVIAMVSLAGFAAAHEWSAYGGDQGGTRHAEASEITPANVRNLVRAWTYRTGHMSAPAAAIERSKFQSTPILVEGKLALCTPFNTMIALDPGTGRELWRYDAQISLEQRLANQYNCRGVTYWRDETALAGQACASRLLMGTNDHRLIAVDLADGKPCADFGVNGAITIDPSMALQWPGEMQITSPPVVAGDVVVVGSAISDNNRVAAPSGVVHAFDARTGAPRWNFDPVPRTPEAATAQDWRGDNVPIEGHANAWAPMSVDEARGLIFAPTSSPSPDFFGGLRPGDNRYANSVVALEAATGQVRWAFQTVHHDVWDYDLPAQPMLATIRKGGRTIDVVIQAAKTGLVFTLDRETGEPVFPVEERPVPQEGVEGETLSPTQPFPVAPEPLAPSTLGKAWGLTPLDRNACQARMDAARNEGLFTPPSAQGTILFPFTGGGANWGGGAYDPARNLFYLNTSSAMHLITLIPRREGEEQMHDERGYEYAPMLGAPHGMTREILLSPIGVPCNAPPWGVLSAVDMDSGAIVWRSTLGTTEDIAPLGLTLHTGTPNVGGPIVTAGGVVFIGAAMDRYQRAFDADSGKELWFGRLPAGGQATPMSYVWEGRQYVVIAAGGHGEADTPRGDYVVAFALPRPGEPGPSLMTRLLDHPGGRFTAGALGLGVALIALIALLFGLRRRRGARTG